LQFGTVAFITPIGEHRADLVSKNLTTAGSSAFSWPNAGAASRTIAIKERTLG
jgi:hypothetical protein